MRRSKPKRHRGHRGFLDAAAATRGWSAVALVSVAAALVLVVGCATTSTRAVQDRTAGLDNPHPKTTDTLRYINQRAAEYQLPDKYLSEARIGVAEVQGKLDTARAAEVQRDAMMRDRFAHVEAKRQEAVSNESITLAEADKLRTEYTSQHNNTAAELAARERNTKARAEAEITRRATLAKEGKSQQSELISQAEHEFAQAQAHINNMRVLRAATEKDGLAEIDQMRENARATRQRAKATIVALRTEAGSVGEQTRARIGELQKQIETTQQRTQATAQRLYTQASSVEQQGRARHNELNARADANEVKASQKEYDLKVTAAKTDRQQAQAA